MRQPFSDRALKIAVTLLVVGTTVWAVPLWFGVWWGARPVVATTPTPSKLVEGGGAAASITPTPSGGAATSATPRPTVDAASWTTAPYIRNFSGDVTKMPKLVAIRSGSHSADSYDRVAFDFNQSSPPGYTIHYTDKVIRDPKGDTVIMPGSAYLQIIFSPAAGHDDAGNSTLINPPTLPVVTQYDQLWSYIMNGDFEGQVSMALGLGSKTGYRVGEIRRDTGWTIYVDVLIR